jgi:hypothetical protein
MDGTPSGRTPMDATPSGRTRMEQGDPRSRTTRDPREPNAATGRRVPQDARDPNTRRDPRARGPEPAGPRPPQGTDEDDTTQTRFRRSQSQSQSAAAPVQGSGWSMPPSYSSRTVPTKRVKPAKSSAPPRSASARPPTPPAPGPPSSRADGPDSVAGFLWGVEQPPRGEPRRDRTGERPRPADPRRPADRPRPVSGPAPSPANARWDEVWPAVPRTDRPGPDSSRTNPRPPAGTRPPGPATGSGRTPNGNGTNGAGNGLPGHAGPAGWTDDWVPPPPPFDPLWPPSSKDWGPAPNGRAVPAPESDPLAVFGPDHLNGTGRSGRGRSRPDDPPRGRPRGSR